MSELAVTLADMKTTLEVHLTREIAGAEKSEEPEVILRITLDDDGQGDIEIEGRAIGLRALDGLFEATGDQAAQKAEASKTS